MTLWANVDDSGSFTSLKMVGWFVFGLSTGYLTNNLFNIGIGRLTDNKERALLSPMLAFALLIGIFAGTMVSRFGTGRLLPGSTTCYE